MPDLKLDFRSLFDLIFKSEESLSVYQNILVPWVASHSAERDWLHFFASRTIDAVSPVDDDIRYRFFHSVPVLKVPRFNYSNLDKNGNVSLKEPVPFSVFPLRIQKTLNLLF